MPPHHHISDAAVCHRWDNRRAPLIAVEPDCRLTLRLRDASDNQVRRGMTVAEFAAIDPGRVHALTGPIQIEGSLPGDSLEITFEEFLHDGWGWSGILPGRGLLPDDFPERDLLFWDIDPDDHTRSLPGVALPVNPFCGIVGVQRAEPGEFRTHPPGPFGGNLDIRHLTRGAVLRLPVLTPGAGLCLGDAHLAQGDGEVCINGIEAPVTVTVRVRLLRGASIAGPQLSHPGPLLPPRINAGNWHATFASERDPIAAARSVVRQAIEYIVRRIGCRPAEAYILCSVALDLKICQLVNQPVVTVGGYLPLSIFPLGRTG